MAQEYVLIKNLQGNVANRKLFYADQNDPTTFPEVKNKTEIAAGSELRVVEDGTKYILNSKFEWQLTPDSSGGGGGGGIPDAPANGNTYGRKDNGWVTVDGGSGGGGILFFLSTASYAIGDMVSYQGMIWKAIANVNPGAFRINQWASLATQIHQYTTGVSYAKGEIILVNTDPTAEGRAYGMYYANVDFTAGTWAVDVLKISPLIALSTQAHNDIKYDAAGALFVKKTTIDDYDASVFYNLGDLVNVAGTIYQCNVDSASRGPFLPSEWIQRGTQYFATIPTNGQYVPLSSIILNGDSLFYVKTAFTATGVWNTDKANCVAFSDITISSTANNALKKLADSTLFVQGEIPNKSIIYIDLTHTDPNAVYLGTQVQPFNTFAQAFTAYGSQTGVTAIVTNGTSTTLTLPATLAGWTFTALAQSLGGQNTLSVLTITGAAAVIDIYFIGFRINTLTAGTVNTKSIHFESCTFPAAITLTTATAASEYSFLHCSFVADVVIGGVGVFELNKCRFKGMAALTIKSSLKVLLIDNPRISVDQQGASQVIAQGSNTFVVPNNISSTYGYTCSTGTTAATTTIFLGGEVLSETTGLPAPIYFLNGYAGTYSLGDLLFNADASNIATIRETLVGLAARQLVDN